MPIALTCPACRAGMHAPDKAAGRTGKCPRCQAQVVVPSRSSGLPDSVDKRFSASSQQAKAVSAPALEVRCAACSHEYTFEAELAAKVVRCPGCGEFLKVPSVSGIQSGPSTIIPGPTEQAQRPQVQVMPQTLTPPNADVILRLLNHPNAVVWTVIAGVVALLALIVCGITFIGSRNSASGTSRLTGENFLRIKPGMGWQELEVLLGKPHKVEKLEMGDSRVETWTWTEGGKEIRVILVCIGAEGLMVDGKFQKGFD